MATTKDLIGTYSYLGNSDPANYITTIIKKNSYCAGTRDDDISISVYEAASNITRLGTIYYTLAGPPNSVIDMIVKIPGMSATKASIFIEEDGTGWLPIQLGTALGDVKIEIVSFNNYPIFKSAPIVTVTDQTPPEDLTYPGIFVYVDKYEEVEGVNLTGTITLHNLVIGERYSGSFRDMRTDLNIDGFQEIFDNWFDGQPDFLATATTMVIPFSVPSTIFETLDTQIEAGIYWWQ